MDITFRQHWHDPRLKFAGPKTPLNLTWLDLVGDEKTNYPIWVPDTFFRNEMMAHVHQETVPNQYIRIFPNGDVRVSRRLVHD